MKAAISFSLWEQVPMYCQGAIRNAELIPTIYPGWTMICWCYPDVPKETISALRKLKVEVRKPKCNNGMFARFFAAEEEWDYVLFRDTDSRVNPREAQAVKEWIESGKRAHVIADHPHHVPVIGGGLWGVKGKFEIGMLIKECAHSEMRNNRNETYNTDQIFLRDIIWPVIKHDSLRHDLCFWQNYSGAKPFPAKFGEDRFVGEVFQADDTPRSFDASIRLNFMTP